MRLAGPADMNDAGALQLVGENVDHQFENIIVQGTKRAVDEHPGRSLQHDPGEGEAELLVLAQLPVPALRGVEQRRKTFQPKPVQCARRTALDSKLSAFKGYASTSRRVPRGI